MAGLYSTCGYFLPFSRSFGGCVLRPLVVSRWVWKVKCFGWNFVDFGSNQRTQVQNVWRCRVKERQWERAINIFCVSASNVSKSDVFKQMNSDSCVGVFFICSPFCKMLNILTVENKLFLVGSQKEQLGKITLSLNYVVWALTRIYCIASLCTLLKSINLIKYSPNGQRMVYSICLCYFFLLTQLIGFIWKLLSRQF